MRKQEDVYGYISSIHLEGCKKPASLEQQEREIKLWAADRKYNLIEIITETDSIEDDDGILTRSGVVTLLTLMRSTRHLVIIIHDIWRLTINMSDMFTLAMHLREKYGDKSRLEFIREGANTESLSKMFILSQIPTVKFLKREMKAEYERWVEAHKTADVVPYEPMFPFNSISEFYPSRTIN